MGGGGLSWLGKQFDDLVELLFPSACLICLNPLPTGTVNSICPECKASICQLPDGRCSRCALPFGASSSSRHLCGDCSRQNPPFQQVHAAGLYQGALKEALQRFKYSGRVELDRPLASLLQSILPHYHGNEIILPVPLHPRKLRQRSYNQSLLIARVLARNLQISLEQAMLERIQDSHSQQGLSAQQRAQNLQGTFICKRSLSGQTLLLVDDVMTTGATLSSCSQVLLDAGAGRVEALVVARAPRY